MGGDVSGSRSQGKSILQNFLFHWFVMNYDTINERNFLLNFLFQRSNYLVSSGYIFDPQSYFYFNKPIPARLAARNMGDCLDFGLILNNFPNAG